MARKHKASAKPEPSQNELLSASGLLFKINQIILNSLGLSLDLDPEKNTLNITDHQTRTGVIINEEEFQKGVQRYHSFMITKGRELLRNRLKEHKFIIQQKGK